MRTTNDYIKDFYFKSTQETVTDEEIQEVFDDTEAADQEPRMVLVNLAELIMSVQKDAITECAERAKITWPSWPIISDDLEVDKQSILSLINELK